MPSRTVWPGASALRSWLRPGVDPVGELIASDLDRRLGHLDDEQRQALRAAAYRVADLMNNLRV
jgi:hypothetical protein